MSQLYCFAHLISFTIIIFRHFSLPVEDSFLWSQYCRKDFEFCSQCFDGNSSQQIWHENIQSIDSEFNINSIFGTRKVQRAVWSNEGQTQNVVLKYSSNDVILDNFMHSFCARASAFLPERSDCDSYWKLAIESNKLAEILTHLHDGEKSFVNSRLCPNSSNDFLRIFNQFTNNSTFWIQFWLNLELVVLKAIQRSENSALKTAVPKVIDWCGFASIEEDTGETTLLDYYDDSFRNRLHLAKQLLEIALAFSHGLNGFRIYLTDATPDNIVVNKSTQRVTIVDLDNLLIVDSNAIQTNNIHRYEPIVDCDNCFAFVPDELCSHHLSDINIFSMCQIFLSGSFADPTRGFLHSIPPNLDETFSLSQLLEQCLYCDKEPNCTNRFIASNRLLTAFTKILENLNGF